MSSSENFDLEEMLNTKDWPGLWDMREKLGYPQFYDKLFDIERKGYNQYLKDYRMWYYNPKIFELIRHQNDQYSKKILDEIKQYICERTGSLQTVYNKGLDTCKDWRISGGDIREFLYFNKTPTFIVEELIGINLEDYEDTMILDGERYRFNYFIWRREGDPNSIKANPDEIITPDNFRNYSRFKNAGWSVKQLRSFFLAKILPIILTKCNINININLPIYKKIIDKPLYRDSLNVLIDEHIKTNTININMDYVSNIRNNIKKAIDREMEQGKDIKSIRIYEINKTRNTGILYDFIAKILLNQAVIKKTLEQKIQNIKTRVLNKDGKYKYKWQAMCAKLSDWGIEQLRELAAIENISNYSMKSKRELCKEFVEILERTLANQRRNQIRYIPEPEQPQDANDTELANLFNRHIQNNLTPAEQRHKERYPEQYSEKCENRDSLLGDDLTDIKPEFFFTYRHNNKIFCDDIRSLYQYIIGGKKHSPYDRTPFSDKLIKTIKQTYNKLEKTLVSMKDIETIVPTESILTSKASDLSGLLFHHAPIENFLNANDYILREFIMYLEEEGVITGEEVEEYIFNNSDLITQKITLVDLLTRKIRNDQGMVGQYSSMASIITDVYNNVFSEQDELSESEIDELASEQDELVSEQDELVSEQDELVSEQDELGDESITLERQASIFLSKLPINISHIVVGLNQSKIITASGTKVSDFIRILVERELLTTNTLYEWTQQNLLTNEGLPVEINLDTLKIKLLQKLIQSIERSDNRQEIVQKIIRSLIITRVFS
jgi:hypothetical protein